MANQAVYGIVNSRADAENVVQALVDAGIPHNNISFLTQQGEQFPELGTSGTVGTNRNWRTEERVTDYPAGTTPEQRYRSTDATSTGQRGRPKQGGLGHEKHTKAPEGATTGATAGGLIGGTLGLLVGIGALAIPGLGPFVAAGPLMATLSGLGAGGALGGIIGALIGAGIPEFEAKRYENRLKEGGILIAVRCNTDEEAKRVKQIMQNQGVEDVTVSSEAKAFRNSNKR